MRNLGDPDGACRGARRLRRLARSRQPELRPARGAEPRGACAQQGDRRRALRAGGAGLRRGGAAARPAAPSRTCATTGACRGRSSSTGCRAAASTRRSRPPASRSTRSSASAGCSTSPRTWACPTTRPTSTRPSTVWGVARGRLSRAAGGRARAPSATGRATCSTSCSTRPGTCCRWRRRTRSSCSGGLDLVNDRYELDPVLDTLLYEMRRQLHRAADQLPAEHARAAEGRDRRRHAGGCLCRPMSPTRRALLLGLGGARSPPRLGGPGARRRHRPGRGSGDELAGELTAAGQLRAQRGADVRGLRGHPRALRRHAGGGGERARPALARRERRPEAGLRRRVPALPGATLRQAVPRVPERPHRRRRRARRRQGGGAGETPRWCGPARRTSPSTGRSATAAAARGR